MGFSFQNLEQKRKSNEIGAPNKQSNIVLFRPNQTKINMENIWMKNKNTKISILLKRPKITFLEEIFLAKKAPHSPDLKVAGGFLSQNSPMLDNSRNGGAKLVCVVKTVKLCFQFGISGFWHVNLCTSFFENQ